MNDDYDINDRVLIIQPALSLVTQPWCRLLTSGNACGLEFKDL